MKLRDIAYYKTGGHCHALYEPKSAIDLGRIVQALQATQQKYFVLGGGTNSLVLDDDWPGAVITFRRMKAIEVRDHTIYAEAGADNSAIAETALAAGLDDAAWLFRLPGQIGGTVRMNARCYGGEISQIASEVHTIQSDGSIKIYQTGDHVFRGYKDTIFMQNNAIVTATILQLKPGIKGSIKTRMQFYESDRQGKGQFNFPTCGCVFKNNYDIGVPSGLLLDKAGAHKLNRPHVALNPKHANFVYNLGASSREILEFTFAMRALVYEKFGVWLEYEMEILGELPVDLQSKWQEKRAHQLCTEKIADLKKIFQAK